MRASFDPLIWFGLLLPLVMAAEWMGAVRSGHVGPGLFGAGCLLALPVLLRLALTPAWFSDLLVILAGLALLLTGVSIIAEMTGTATVSKPGSAVLIVPALLLGVGLVIGSLAQWLLCFWPWMKPVHEALQPCGQPLHRGLVAALVLTAWWTFHRFHPLAL